jgi:UDP-N-acetylglucosamine 2-epimerase (non-hydrolysing)
VRVLHVVGARPNFVKAAPVMAALAARRIAQTLVHTGQHYDVQMSDVFFRELSLPEPDINLEVGSGTHAAQTAQVMLRIEPVLKEVRPDWVLVYGDVNSTVAAALVCAKLPIPVAHVEAGLRSGDRTMPEEFNRLLTDQMADLLFTPSEDGDENLQREGVPASRIRRVGNVMIDTLVRLLPAALARWDLCRAALELPARYGLVTLHRPSNVDEPGYFKALMDALGQISHDIPLVFPVHPRTRAQLGGFSLERFPSLRLTDPVGYLDFLALQRHAQVVITDSGGIQEETTYLGVPCLTVRENTERPITVTLGTNTLVGRDPRRLRAGVENILGGGARKGQVPPLWDGRAGERIAAVLAEADRDA